MSNGRIDGRFVVNTNFDNITDDEIKIIENWINNRSMKVLGWKSPNEMFKSVAL